MAAPRRSCAVIAAAPRLSRPAELAVKVAAAAARLLVAQVVTARGSKVVAGRAVRSVLAGSRGAEAAGPVQTVALKAALVMAA